ncbi:MAG: UDP-N-acetylmuramate--L-alanine ligase [Gemmatimonadota bacterium]|nr:MAG: UDP-N-acetylmuramate--L-alanine ligase [Gemmatimonadota bacterium]
MRPNTELARLVERGAPIHLLGIGGAGMASLALLLQARGARVSGCDQELSDMTADLERRGISVERGHSPEHAAAVEALVYTAAIPEDHPELRAARERGLPAIKRSSALGELANAGRLVAVAGTHGKTTTTALTAMALEAAGVDPVALVGGRVPAWGGNARIGGGQTFVVEADEYDRSFLALWPLIAVVTSVEPEHLDTYGSTEEMEAAFDNFVSRVPDEGRVVVCTDDPGARRRLRLVGQRGLSYGLRSDADLRAEHIDHAVDRTHFSASWRGEPIGSFELLLRGEHNVRNALASLGVLLAMDIEPGVAAGALAGFGGVERRFQKLGEAGGITVIDDYAHHPTEVAATLDTAKLVFKDQRLVAAFQPHLYSRTAAFAVEFGKALARADVVFVTDVYRAREAPIPGVTGELVATAARAQRGGDGVRYRENLAALRAALREELRAGDVLITLGAGDIGQMAHVLFDELRRSHVDA